MCRCCATTDEHAEKVAASFPPLTPEQVADLQILFGPAVEAVAAQHRRRRRSTNTSRKEVNP